MVDNAQARQCFQTLGGAVGGTIIDREHIVGVLKHLAQDIDDRWVFVIDRQTPLTIYWPFQHIPFCLLKNPTPYAFLSGRTGEHQQ